MSNALQEFAEINGYASPDYVQTLSARYGSSLSYGVAQKPVFLGSADIPMYTSGVEQTAFAQNGEFYSNNPLLLLVPVTAVPMLRELSLFVNSMLTSRVISLLWLRLSPKHSISRVLTRI